MHENFRGINSQGVIAVKGSGLPVHKKILAAECMYFIQKIQQICMQIKKAITWVIGNKLEISEWVKRMWHYDLPHNYKLGPATFLVFDLPGNQSLI